MSEIKKIGLLVLIIDMLLFVCICTKHHIFTSSRSSNNDIQQDAGSYDTDTDTIKKVALTFDDGPHKVYTPQLLDGLKERNVKATFFLIGKNIDGNEEIVQRMANEGHLIGNHTYNHVRLTEQVDSKANQEIMKTNQIIYDITGMNTIYIRPPFGSWNEDLECAYNMMTVLWDVDPHDWKTKSSRQVVRHVIKNADDGDIILLHDVYPTSVEAAFEIIDELKAKGYEFVTIDQLKGSAKVGNIIGK